MAELKSGSQIKELLKSKGITIMDLAKEFNIHFSSVSRKINQSYTMPAEFLLSMAKYSKIDVYEFINADKNDFGIPDKLMDNTPVPPYTDEDIRSLMFRVKVLESVVDRLTYNLTK